MANAEAVTVAVVRRNVDVLVVGKVGSLHGTLYLCSIVATHTASVRLLSHGIGHVQELEGQKEGPASSSNQFSQPSDKEVRAN